MTAVIDASGAMEILLNKEKADKFHKILYESTLVITPDLYVSELANTLWKYHSAKILTKDECLQLVQQGIKLIDKFISGNEIWEEALSEGIKNKHSVYDMFYMVITRRNSGVLITSDSTLASICNKNRVQVCF